MSLMEFLKPRKGKLKYFLILAVIFLSIVAVEYFIMLSQLRSLWGTLPPIQSEYVINKTPSTLLYDSLILAIGAIIFSYLAACIIYHTKEQVKKGEIRKQTHDNLMKSE